MRRISQNPYKEKILLNSGNTVYVYGKRDLARRKRKKADRCKTIKQNLGELLKSVDKDIRSGSDIAAVVGVILCTYERVGNETSANSGHYGAINIERRHVSKSGKNIVLDYVGKSGVKHSKIIMEPIVVVAITQRLQSRKPNDKIFDCTPVEVNQYLAQFGITSKDIRTFAANKFMMNELRAQGITKAQTRKERLEIFRNALESVSEMIGHNPATLKSQYLSDALKTRYLS